MRSRRRASRGLFNVPAGVVPTTEDVVIVEGVERLAPRAAHTDKAGAAEQAQLMRHRGLGKTDERSQVAHTALTVAECVHQPHARGVTEEFEHLGHSFDSVAWQQTPLDVSQRSHIRRVTCVARFNAGSRCRRLRPCGGRHR